MIKFDPETSTVSMPLEDALLLKRCAWDGPEPSGTEVPRLEQILEAIETIAGISEGEECSHTDSYGSLFDRDGRCRLCGYRA